MGAARVARQTRDNQRRTARLPRSVLRSRRLVGDALRPAAAEDPQVIESLADPQIWIALATLTFLEIVLGVDNIIFISILSGKLPPAQQPTARRVGLLLAMGTRILLLFS